MVKIMGLYAITDPQLISDKHLFRSVEFAILGGAKVVQYRNKLASQVQQYEQAEQLSYLCQQHQVTFIINDDPLLAKSVKAAGVHLGQDDGKIADARQLLGEQGIIGVSCYNRIEKAISAMEQGADYIAFGRFFPSKTKPAAVQAEDNLLEQARQQLSIPIVAIGGINLNNASQLIKHGADAIAVIHSLFHEPQEIYNTAKAYQALFNNSGSESNEIKGSE
ncbi:MAG: thiamine phosphate synthase [gamma proteobacterium symbiont of Taylorina sp.]|nr:thiamine phosphate synthase [gamma proteobacterium symbiont of Taylorina sp.]